MGTGTESELGENYGSMAPQDIQSDKANIQFLIVRQLDRTNWLKSISLAGKINRNQLTALLIGIRGSIQSIELLLAPYLEDKVLKEIKAIKEKLDKDYTFKDPADDVIRKIRYLQRVKYKPKGEILEKTYTLANDTNKYMDLLDEWNLILMKNLKVANLAPLKKTRFDY